MKTQDMMFKEMNSELQGKYELFYRKMYDANLPFELNEVLRTLAVQTAYYAQSRKPIDEVNRLRKLAGLSMLPPSENLKPVTWTMKSRHFAGPDGLSRAFDIRLLKYGKPTWDTKWDGNSNSVPDYLEAARIGVECGLDAGGMWSKPDYPHFQLKDKK